VDAARVLHAALGLPIPIADSDVADNVVSTGAAGALGARNVPAVDGNARSVPVTDRDAPACHGGDERAMLVRAHSQRIYTNVKGEDFTTPGGSRG
jgi:hypothetical protein